MGYSLAMEKMMSMKLMNLKNIFQMRRRKNGTLNIIKSKMGKF